jgi:AmmeMemoRadiSam system protein A
MAVQAAVGDPRFPAMESEELDKINIEISVLSELEKIDDINKIEVGKHGILIRKGFYSGLLLPQVATEYGWDRNEFLEHTCFKAGLPADAYKSGADIYIFSAEVFGEK